MSEASPNAATAEPSGPFAWWIRMPLYGRILLAMALGSAVAAFGDASDMR
jgi:hypothetical protein